MEMIVEYLILNNSKYLHVNCFFILSYFFVHCITYINGILRANESRIWRLFKKKLKSSLKFHDFNLFIIWHINCRVSVAFYLMRFLCTRIPHLTTRHQKNIFRVESESHLWGAWQNLDFRLQSAQILNPIWTLI